MTPRTPPGKIRAGGRAGVAVRAAGSPVIAIPRASSPVFRRAWRAAAGSCAERAGTRVTRGSDVRRVHEAALPRITVPGECVTLSAYR